MSDPKPSTALRRNSLGVAGIVFLVLAAVAPLTGVVVVASLAIALGNGGGAPASFLIVAVILLLFAVGYAQMSKQLVNAGGEAGVVFKRDADGAVEAVTCESCSGTPLQVDDKAKVETK